MKTRHYGYVILLILIIFKLCSSFLLQEQFEHIYTYIINPVTWFLLCIVAYTTLSNHVPKRFRYRGLVSSWLVISALIFVIIYYLLGLITGYGNNPYNNSLNGILLNFISLGSIIIMMEYIRFLTINSVQKSERIYISILMVITFMMVEVNILSLNTYFESNAMIFKLVTVILIPKLLENILLINTALEGGFMPNVMYRLIMNGVMWLTPILPILDWFIVAILYSLIHFLTYINIRYRIVKEKYNISVRLSRTINMKTVIINFIIVVMAVLFMTGYTPYVPTTIISNSMNPNVKVGDIIVAKRGTASNLKEGDIVHYIIDKKSVIHRIVEKTNNNGEINYITKGDNNRSKDPKPVNERQVVGKVVAVIPKLGYPSYLFNKIFHRIGKQPV